MDLRLTLRGDYAVRAAIGLARAAASGDYLKLREVSTEMAIPLRYTQEILSHLMRAGLAEARAGKQGGYRLTREPSQISLLEIVEAAEGPLRIGSCTLRGGSCHWQNTVCAVHDIWQEANGALTGLLNAQTLATIVAVDNGLRAEAESPGEST